MPEVVLNDKDTRNHVEDFLAYTVDLTQRQRWIIDEMKRRGYLPHLTGEERYL